MKDTSSNEKKRCEPCESMDKSMILSEDDIQNEIKTSLWSVVSVNGEYRISRSFVAKNFQCALDAINKMGSIAERENHHPDFHLTSYRNVEVVIYTHGVGGVTKNDLILAKMLDDEVDVTYSPKWLKENPLAAKN